MATPKRKKSAPLLPTQAKLAAWYRTLAVTGPTGERGGNMLFYEACWSSDAGLARVYEAWFDAMPNPDGLPFDLFEEQLADAGRFAELHAILRRFTAEELARAVPLMRAFVAGGATRPKRR